MAGKKPTERIYTIPLRSEWMKVPRNRRANRAKTAIQEFLMKHLHTSEVKISQMLNETIWFRGIEKPPSKIKIKANIDENNVVTARLPEEAILKEAMKKTQTGEKSLMEQAKERIEARGTQPQKETKPKEETPKTEEKAEEKKEEPAEKSKEPTKEVKEDKK